ncbi:hypothetical protein K461DRAFT_275962 [Myriangium duriaei CBS 260.36]|uniref:Phospholipid/glycerol acyltransferase domain-containing protein n=1 Tax=Myriangium duriaei CBS 260.36 TaxID=1168546 RepID=A0A9P4J9B2_9PEZI|nr:hypothetical protein K461DRAFT_275962 [Myriangium duriaei CBS 260.36]
MEKYGAFRDKGSGIAPFFPVPSEPAGISLPVHAFLAFVRIPLLIGVSLVYFLLFSWLPIGSLGKKAALWCILGVPGIWWVDLQVDGVKRGSLGRNSGRLPHAGSVIASSYTSPIDALYLAAIFDPLFTRSFPGTKQVQQISLWQAMLDALLLTPKDPPILGSAHLVDVATILKENPDRCVAVFPECTTSNGRGILPFSPSILTVPEKRKIFPVSLRYTPADITTPVPGSYITFLWNLCSRPTHTIRVRIAEATYNTSLSPSLSAASKEMQPVRRPSYETNFLDELQARIKQSNGNVDRIDELSAEEVEVLDRIGEALARLGRVKRVGLGVEDKTKFVRVWSKRR